MNKKILFFIAVFGLAGAISHGSQIIAYWNQNDNALPNGGFGFLADPDVFPQNADQGSGTLTVGGGLLTDTSTNNNGDVVYSWIPSFGGSTLNAQDSDPSGGSISILGGTENGNNGSHFQFGFSMTGYEDLVVSYATRGTASGFTSHAWSYSTDGTSFTPLQTFTGRNATSFSVLELDTISSLNDASTAFLRVTFDGATGTTGNNRLDNFLFEASAIPEPSMAALMVIGIALIGRFIRKK